jgi:hypothetical protein
VEFVYFDVIYVEMCHSNSPSTGCSDSVTSSAVCSTAHFMGPLIARSVPEPTMVLCCQRWPLRCPRRTTTCPTHCSQPRQPVTVILEKLLPCRQPQGSGTHHRERVRPPRHRGSVTTWKCKSAGCMRASWSEKLLQSWRTQFPDVRACKSRLAGVALIAC